MQNAVTHSGLETLPDYAKLLAKFGRFEDTYIVHAAEGETVVPLQVLNRNPALKEMLFNQMRDMGLEPERYIVGNELNSLNPVTGQPEFFFKEIWGGIKSALKIAAPVLGAIAGSFIPIPIVGPMIGSFVASKIAGYSTQSALLGAAASGIGAYALGGSAAAAAGGYTGAMGGTSLGSALYGGLTQQGMSQGLASLVTAAPTAAVDTAATSVGSAFSLPAATSMGQTGSAFLGATAPAAAAAAPATNFASGTIFGPLVNFGLKNPGAMLAGGAMLASLLDKPEDVKPQMTDMRTGWDTYKKNPGQYNIHGLGKRKSSHRLADYEVSPYGEIPQYHLQQPQIDGSEFPVYDINGNLVAAHGGHIEGPGTGTSDSIPAMLSDGEFVMTAKAVRGAGGGDRKKGAREMYKMMRQFEALHG